MVGVYIPFFFPYHHVTYVEYLVVGGTGKLRNNKGRRKKKKVFYIYFFGAEWLAAATSLGGRSVKKVSLTTLYFPWGPFCILPSTLPVSRSLSFVKYGGRES